MFNIQCGLNSSSALYWRKGVGKILTEFSQKYNSTTKQKNALIHFWKEVGRVDENVLPVPSCGRER